MNILDVDLQPQGEMFRRLVIFPMNGCGKKKAADFVVNSSKMSFSSSWHKFGLHRPNT